MARFRSPDSTRRAAAGFAVASTVCFALGGCGVNITPRPADSTAGDSTSPQETSASPQTPVAMPGGMPMASNGNVAYSPASAPSSSPEMTEVAGSYDATPADPSTDPAQMAEQMRVEVGPEANPEGPAGGHAAAGAPGGGPANNAEAAARAAYAAREAEAAGANAGPNPEQMQALMEQQRLQFEQQQQQLDPRAAAGAAAAELGARGVEGGEGATGGGRANRFEEGTPAYTVMQLVAAIDANDLETAAQYVSEDADGLLGQVREGTVGENQVRQLQSYFATMDPLSQRPRGRSITLNFNGSQSKVLSFVVVREGREFLVDSMTIRDAQSRRGR